MRSAEKENQHIQYVAKRLTNARIGEPIVAFFDLTFWDV